MFNAGEPIDREGTAFRVIFCANAVAAPARAKARTEMCFLVMEHFTRKARTRSALSKRIPDQRRRANMPGTGLALAAPDRQGLNRRFVTLRIAPTDTCRQAPGLRGELLEHHSAGVGNAAWPPEGNLRAGFPGTVGLRRAVGVGR